MATQQFYYVAAQGGFLLVLKKLKAAFKKTLAHFWKKNSRLWRQLQIPKNKLDIFRQKPPEFIQKFYENSFLLRNKKMSTLLWNFPTKQRNFPGSDPYSFNQNRNFYLKLPLQPITQIASCQCFSTILSFIHFMSNLTILTIKVNWKKFNLASFKLSLRCLRGCAQFFLSIDSIEIESQFWRNRLCIFFWLDV